MVILDKIRNVLTKVNEWFKKTKLRLVAKYGLFGLILYWVLFIGYWVVKIIACTFFGICLI